MKQHVTTLVHHKRQPADRSPRDASDHWPNATTCIVLMISIHKLMRKFIHLPSFKTETKWLSFKLQTWKDLGKTSISHLILYRPIMGTSSFLSLKLHIVFNSIFKIQSGLTTKPSKWSFIGKVGDWGGGLFNSLAHIAGPYSNSLRFLDTW